MVGLVAGFPPEKGYNGAANVTQLMEVRRRQRVFGWTIALSLVASSFVAANFSGFNFLNLTAATEETSEPSPGLLVVSVGLASVFFGPVIPVGGAQVNVTRLGTFGFPLSSQTNGSGVVAMELAPGPR